MLATQVIATGITHLTDARYFAAWEVDYLAFPLTGPDAIDWTTLNAMREWITGPELIVEIDGGFAAGGLLSNLRDNDIHRVLTPHTAPASSQKILTEGGMELFVRVPVAGYQSTDDIAELLVDQVLATAIILDFDGGGITWQDLRAGHPFGLEDLQRLLAGRSIYLEIGLDGNNPKSVASEYPIKGFAVRGSSEEKVGYKSYDDLDPLFEGLEDFG